MSPTKEFEQSSAGTGSKEFEEKQEFIVHGVKVNIRPSEKEFVQELFDALAAIPTGRQAIEDMKKYNTTLLLEPGSEKEKGLRHEPVSDHRRQRRNGMRAAECPAAGRA